MVNNPGEPGASATAGVASPPPIADAPGSPSTLFTIAACLIILTASWFLLQQLAGLLRPLVLAIFLAYIILPLHTKLLNRLPRLTAYIVLAVTVTAILFGMSMIVYASVLDLSDQLPRLFQRAQMLYQEANRFWVQHLAWLTFEANSADGLDIPSVGWLRNITGVAANAAADALAEALVVGLYLLFLLLEAHRFPNRVRMGFTEERSVQILEVAGRVNGAIAQYLKAKGQASLLLALPVTVILWACGVKFALLWGALTFLCNFIPYLGSAIAITVPLAFGFLDLYPSPAPFVAAAGVIATHLAVTYLVELKLTSRAVGLSPLVILIALAFWGQVWGLIGMFLAVPLTVMVKIMLENVAFTRPFAELLGDRLT